MNNQATCGSDYVIRSLVVHLCLHCLLIDLLIHRTLLNRTNFVGCNLSYHNTVMSL